MNGERLRAFVCVREIQSSSGASGLGRGRGRCRTAVSSLGGPPWSRDPTPARTRDRAAKGGEGLPGRLPGFPRGLTSRTLPRARPALEHRGEGLLWNHSLPRQHPPGAQPLQPKINLSRGDWSKDLSGAFLIFGNRRGAVFFATKLEKKIEQLFSHMLKKLRQILTGFCLEFLSFLKDLSVFCDRRTSNPFLVVEGDGEEAESWSWPLASVGGASLRRVLPLPLRERGEGLDRQKRWKTHTHTYAHIRTHTHAHTSTNTPTPTPTHTHTYARTHT